MNQIIRIIKKDYTAWLIMLPSIILFAFYIWIPLLQTVSLSFYETIGVRKVEFIGLGQYRILFTDDLFLKALVNSFEYVFWSIIIGFFIPILLALILNEVVHFRGFFRMAVYFPNIIPGIAVAIMWTFLLDPNPYGVLNSLFKTEYLWLHDSRAVIPIIVLTMTWKGAGATALIYLASLQTIDPVYYEAARIEGASGFQRFRHVTFPHLLNQIKVLFILQVITVFQVFYEPLVMTKGGGPNGQSSTLVQLIFKYRFEDGNAGKASALSVIVAIILLSLTGFYFLINTRKKA